MRVVVARLKHQAEVLEHERWCAEMHRFLNHLGSLVRAANVAGDEAKIKRLQRFVDDFREEIIVERVAAALVDFQKRSGRWTGTVLELLTLLQPPSIYSSYGDGFWPTTPHQLVRWITMAAPLLDYKGVAVTRQRRSRSASVFTVSGCPPIAQSISRALKRRGSTLEEEIRSLQALYTVAADLVTAAQEAQASTNSTQEDFDV